jgi:hypothetical protein
MRHARTLATLRHDMFELEFYSYKSLAQAIKVIHACDSAIALRFEGEQADAQDKAVELDLTSLFKDLTPVSTPFTNAIANAIANKRCAGLNCTSTDGHNHSIECQAQHDVTIGKAILGEGPALETSEDCAIYYPERFENGRFYEKGSLINHHGTDDPGQFHATSRAIPFPRLEIGVAEKAAPAQPQHSPNVATQQALVSEWFLGEVVKMMSSAPYLNMEPGLFYRMTSHMARWLSTWIEEPETLQHSTLHNQALFEVAEYPRKEDARKRVGSQEQAINELADAYEQAGYRELQSRMETQSQELAQARAKFDELNLEYGKFIELGVKHGWSKIVQDNAPGLSLLDQFSKWLDQFIELADLHRTQAESINDLLSRNEVLVKANAAFESRGNQITELDHNITVLRAIIDKRDKTILKLNRKVQKLTAAK